MVDTESCLWILVHVIFTGGKSRGYSGADFEGFR